MWQNETNSFLSTLGYGEKCVVHQQWATFWKVLKGFFSPFHSWVDFPHLPAKCKKDKIKGWNVRVSVAVCVCVKSPCLTWASLAFLFCNTLTLNEGLSYYWDGEAIEVVSSNAKAISFASTVNLEHHTLCKRSDALVTVSEDEGEREEFHLESLKPQTLDSGATDYPPFPPSQRS